MHILIVDDDQFIRETLADLLEMNGYQVATAEDGSEGFNMARSSVPAAIVTDLSMPVMDGYGLLDACRRDTSLQAVPVIVASAMAAPADIRKAMEKGASGYLIKPFTGADLVRSLSACLAKPGPIVGNQLSHTAEPSGRATFVPPCVS